MPDFRHVLERLVPRSTARARRTVENLEQWERLATPEELAEFLGRDDVREAA